MSRRHNALTRAAFVPVLFFALFFFQPVKAEQLPLKLYTSADGLASSAVTNVSIDSRGFLWFTTRDGLSRFDGREFVNYRLNDNSSALTFWDLLETRDGSYWISTSDGLYRVAPRQNAQVRPVNFAFKPGEPVKLIAEKAANESPIVLFEDSRGRLWGGAGNAFLIAENGQVKLEKIDLGMQAQGNRQNPNVVSITETPDGSLWFATIAGAARRLLDGKVIFYPIAGLADYEGSQVMRADRAGRIWIVHSGGLFVFVPETISELTNAPNFSSRNLVLQEQNLHFSGKIVLPEKSGVLYRLKPAKLIAGSSGKQPEISAINGFFVSADGKIWISSREDLFVLDGENYRHLRDTSGFPFWTGKIVEDSNGDLWIGTTGVMKFSRAGLTSYAAADGLSETNIQAFRESADGTVYFIHGVDWRVSRLTESGIETARLALPESAKMLWTSNAALLDEAGDWWALAENGLYRFAANSDLKSLGRQKPQKVYGMRDGLKGNSLYCAFRDSRGNIWFSTRGRPEFDGLTMYDSKTGEFRAFHEVDGFPSKQSPVSFAEDKAGNLWFGLYNGGLVRYSNGRFTDFSKADNLPQGSIFGLYADEKGRLWIGTSRDGVSRVDNPSAEKLTFTRYTTAEGLVSNNVRTLTGDLHGNIYAGTVRGISRIAPGTGNIRHYTTADGLAADFVVSSFRDRSGTLWFGTTNGFSKLQPEPETVKPSAPQVFIAGLNIAGNYYSVSEFGQREVGGIEVGHTENNLQISFVSVGGALRYQYKLEGSGQDWSSPTEQRTVNFANLAPGSYKFLVRAVNAAGQTSENPAVVTWTITPPFWQKWWFVALAALVVGGAVLALDRYRVSKTRQVKAALAALKRSKEERLAELERVRTRIATDLHDDIGASLTQIAVLSEVARRQIPAQKDQNIQPLESISTLSNELVETMIDIVWAINPRKDNLRDLVQRMRRFAADGLSAKKIKLEFNAPDVESQTSLGANLRREIFAIFKESVNNIVKHSEATKAEISLDISDERLHLKISDNGRGFDQEKFLHDSFMPGMGGNGLANIERRARELGGKCEIISFPGGGTTVLLDIPLISGESENNITTQMGGENGNGNG